MRCARSFVLALVGAIVAWQPLAASAAWRFEDQGPHRVQKEASTEGSPADTRSMAPKAGVATARPVAPHASEPPVGTRSLAPKAGVAMTRSVAPRDVDPDQSRGEMPLATD